MQLGDILPRCSNPSSRHVCIFNTALPPLPRAFFTIFRTSKEQNLVCIKDEHPIIRDVSEMFIKLRDMS
jgi:hypothetical protein